jgi:Family of unknown function (DUF5908)
MTLEVRQLVLKSTVSADDDEIDDEGSGKPKKTAGDGSSAGDDGCCGQEQLKEEILAECRAWLLGHLQQLRER